MFVSQHKKNLISSVVAILVLVGFILGCMVFSLTANASSSISSSSISTSSSSQTPISNGGELSITSYVTHVNGQIVTQITPGMVFSLELRLHDSRIIPENNPMNLEILPRGKMNTSSFTPTNPSAVSMGRNGLQVGEGGGGYDYILDFDMVYSGVGNTFQADVYYEGPVGDYAPLQSITITLNNCVPTPDSSSSEPISSSSQVVRGTAFALKDASYGEEAIMAGDDFNLTLTMLSTNGSNNIENVSATIVPDQNFSLSSGSSTIYFGTAAPNQNIPLEFNLKAAANAEDGSYKVTINVAGVSALTGEQVTTAVDISIPVMQPDRFVVNNFTPPDYITAGPGDGSGYMSIELVNMGKSIVSNVVVNLESEGVYSEEGQIYVGNFQPGAKNGVDITVLADSPGTYDATIVISYENARGEVNEIREPFGIEVGEAMMDDSFVYDFPVEEETTGPPAFLIILLVVAILGGAGIVVAVVLKKKRQKAKEAELEDDDDEDL